MAGLFSGITSLFKSVAPAIKPILSGVSAAKNSFLRPAATKLAQAVSGAPSPFAKFINEFLGAPPPVPEAPEPLRPGTIRMIDGSVVDRDYAEMKLRQRMSKPLPVLNAELTRNGGDLERALRAKGVPLE
jgi:hypothetical protein